MKYLFEDKAEDYLSHLFCYSLPEHVKSQIVYAEGNGNLVNKSRELLDAGEIVVVILDTIPANKSIRDIYISLRRLSRQYDYRLIVWNIICAEYYFIRCFGQSKSLKAFDRDLDFDLVSNILPYKESTLIQTEEDKAFTKTFEKFCKLYIMKNGAECIYPDSIFFMDDCKCDTDCESVLLSDKSEVYRKAYEMVIGDNNSMDELWKTHRELLKNTNGAIERYNDAGYQNIKEYPIIR